MLLLRAFALHASCFSGQKNQQGGVEGPRQPGKTCKSLKEGFTRVRRPLRGRVTNAHTSKGCSTCTTFSPFPPPSPHLWHLAAFVFYFLFLFFFYFLNLQKKEYRYYTFYMRVRFRTGAPGAPFLIRPETFPKLLHLFPQKKRKKALGFLCAKSLSGASTHSPSRQRFCAARFRHSRH